MEWESRKKREHPSVDKYSCDTSRHRRHYRSSVSVSRSHQRREHASRTSKRYGSPHESYSSRKERKKYKVKRDLYSYSIERRPRYERRRSRSYERHSRRSPEENYGLRSHKHSRDMSQGASVENRRARRGSSTRRSLDRHYKRRDSLRREDTRHRSRQRSVSSKDSCKTSESEKLEELTEEQLLLKQLGITQFNSTKGQNHLATDLSGVNKKTKRRYRQYMNRRGGFNRPLSPVF
jgi:U4/U6.U5 tri-snRNP-associated protein 3